MTSKNSIRVLIRVQDPDVRWLFSREVHRLGLRLVEATDDAGALELLAEGAVALCLIEDREGDDSTLEFARHVRQEHPATEVILFAATASAQRAFAFGNLRVADYLVKPFEQAGPLDKLFAAAVERYLKVTSGEVDPEQVGQRMKALAKLVDRMPMGIVLVDARRFVLLSNHMARSILEEHDGLLIGEGRLLEARLEQDTATLQQLVNAALPEAMSGGYPTGGATTISRGDDRPPLCLMVGPLEAALDSVAMDDPVVAVIITDAEQELEPREKILCRLYGLSPMQARIAVKLMQGRRVDEAAGELNVSIHTARSHLKAIYAKTGTSRQGELVSYLLSGPATICLGNSKRGGQGSR